MIEVQQEGGGPAGTSKTGRSVSLSSALRFHLPPVALWSVIWALFFATLLLGQARLPAGDFAGQFHAYGLFQAQEMAAGRLPLWLPGSHAGTPFAADTQAAVFYPPRWLTVLFSLPWDFPLYALQLEALLHIWLGGLFTYLLAWELTRQRGPSLLAALAFGLGGYLTSYPLLQLAVLETIIWLPLVLWFLRRGVSATRPVPWLVAAGFTLGIAALAGHPQTMLHVAYLSIAYYLFQAIRVRWSWRAVLGMGALVGGLAVGVAAAGYIPAAVLVANSTRSDVTYTFVSSGMALQDFAQLLLPGVLSPWSPQFVGVATLALALFAWTGRHLGNRAEIIFWTLTALLACWLALGDAGMLFQAAYYLLPGLSLFRQQERLIGLASLATALLAAQGLALWWQCNASQRQTMTGRITVAITVLLLASAAYLLADPQPILAEWLPVWGRQAVITLPALALLWGVGQRSRPFPTTPLLLVLLALDLSWGTAAGINRQPGSPAEYWPQPAWLQQLQADLADDPLARIDSRNLFHANLGPIYGLEDVHGISPLKLRRLEQFQKIPITVRWQLLGVHYVLDYAAPDPAAQPVGEITENVYPEREIWAQLFQFDRPLPRAWMSYQPVIVESAEAARAWLERPEFDPAGQVILHKPPPETATITAPAAPPTVQTERLDSRTLRIQVNTETPGFLVISEWDYPGWRATLDGQPVTLVPADFALQGLVVPAGSHEIILQFRPLDVPIGITISLLAVGLGLLLAWRWRPVIAQREERLAFPALPVPAPPQVTALLVYWRPVLLALTLLGFGLRMHNLGDQELRGDEGYSYPFTQIPLREVLPTLAPVGEEHAPLHYLLLNAWTTLAGDSEFAMRIPAVVPGVLLIPLLFVLGRRIHGRAFGLLLALPATLSQSLVWLGQDVRNQYVAVIFFGTLATLLLARAVARPSWWRWALYALACALTMYSHYYGLFALLAHAFYLLAVPAHRRQLLAWITAGFTAALLFAPWFLATFGGWVGQLDEPGRPALATFLVTVGRELTVGPAFAHPLGRWLFLGALVLAGVGFAHLWQRHRAWAALLGGWMLLATAGVFVILLRRSIFNDYYIAPAAPAWWALVGMGILVLGRSPAVWRRWLAALSVVAVALAATLSLYHYYDDPVRFGRTRGNRALVAHVAERQAEGDLFIANFPDPALSYYTGRLDIPRLVQPADSPQPAATTEAALAELAGQYDRLWFVPEHGAIWDPESVAYRWLDYHLLLEEAHTFTNLSLYAFRPAHAVDEVMAPLDAATLEGAVRLAGAYLTVNGAPVTLLGEITLPAGAELAVTLIWDVERPVPQDYVAFVHLLAADGALLAQHDGVPLYGTRPTTTWQPGERLLDRHVFVVPEGAVLDGGQLVAGLYDATTVTRATFTDGRDTVWLANLLDP